MKIDTPWLRDPAAQQVTGLLEAAGYQALFVGGCVRNALLDAPVSDLDISTDAHPKVVMQLATDAGLRAVPTGIDHGTITVIANGQPFEITTFRKDVETDGRRAVVAFAKTPEQDAQRRDFTMNALYCDRHGAVMDPVGGLPDLRARQVRFIGDPHERLREDYLRILRFFRFFAWYGADLDADGLAACAAEAEGLHKIARERIGQEMLKLLAAPDPAPATAAMQHSGILMRCLPGAETSALAPLVHLEQQLDLAPDAIRRLAVIGGEDPASQLRLSRAQVKALSQIQTGAQGNDPAAALGYRLGAALGLSARLVRAASLGHPPAQDWAPQAERGAAQRLPIAAADLAERYSGPALGRALKAAEAAWVASDFTLSRDDLLSSDFH